MLSLNAGAAGVQGRHRHHPQTSQTQQTPIDKQSGIAAQAADSAATQGIEAFSDTSSVAVPSSTDTAYQAQNTTIDLDDGSFSHEVIKRILGGTIGIGGTLIAITIVLAVLLCMLAPFIVLAFFLRYLIKRHNSKVSLAEKAMETGSPLPNALASESPESANYYLQRGIRNTAIGVGLLIMFAIWDSSLLMGIGALVACYGLGQIVIAKKTK